MMPTLPPTPIVEPSALLPTTFRSDNFSTDLSQMTHWEPLIVFTWDGTVCGLSEMAYNSRKLFEENADQWNTIVEADPSVHESLQLKRVAVVLERQALEQRCRAWADQALAIY